MKKCNQNRDIDHRFLQNKLYSWSQLRKINFYTSDSSALLMSQSDNQYFTLLKG